MCDHMQVTAVVTYGCEVLGVLNINVNVSSMHHCTVFLLFIYVCKYSTL
jgi:hypothetical protein